ncbi:MAG: DMT family transporter [Gammaproteobacteria bacterium]|nr:DMT family transporter [Gammaproteobacteria bacterium]
MTALALLAFAGNSILCRLALLPYDPTTDNLPIDPISFTSVRLLSGAITLMLIVLVLNRSNTLNNKGSWLGAFYLFMYAIAFSFAYVSLDTGVGALILFGSVQITMIVYNMTKGHKPNAIEWFGLLLAFCGLIYLVAPTLSSPSFIGFLLMLMAGVAWGAYTIAAKGVSSPLLVTRTNFIKTVPLVIVAIVITWFFSGFTLSTKGVMFAVLSGSLASGVGYALWYAVVTHMKTTQAAVLQLLVPIIAALGGVLFAGEEITVHLMISSSLILGGVWCVVLSTKILSKATN